jgi:hypothetical protein
MPKSEIYGFEQVASIHSITSGWDGKERLPVLRPGGFEAGVVLFSQREADQE